MKITAYISVLFIALACWQCNMEEDALDTELGSYHRNYDVNSPDTVIRFISNYYYKYGRLFIIDPDSSDYLYNFQYKNQFYIGIPEQSTEHLLYGISLMKRLFMDAYPEECIKKHFPFSLIISDSIKQTDFPGNNKDYYVTRSFIALNIGNMTKDYTLKQLQDLSFQMHIDYIMIQLYQYQKTLDLTEFFAFGQKLYETNTEKDNILSEEEIWATGFLYDRATHGGWLGKDYSTFPSQLEDLKDYLCFMMGYQEKYSKVPTNVEELVSTYPTIRKKYDALAKAIKETTGADIKDLKYKEE